MILDLIKSFMVGLFVIVVLVALSIEFGQIILVILGIILVCLLIGHGLRMIIGF